jgi:two-component system phosphate regulon response regulator PhoB
MSAVRILYVEDERDLSQLVSSHLKELGYEVDQAYSFSQALLLFQVKKGWDLVLLDLYLPDGDGLELLKFFRQTESLKRTPIIILSARSGDMNRIKGLELGADDYLEKPFSLVELSLRIKKVLARAKGLEKPREASILTYKLGAHQLVIDKLKREVLLDGESLSFSPMEFKILLALAENEGAALSRDELLAAVWGDEGAVFDRTVDAFIAKIRKKLGLFKDCLETVRGYGYRFKVEPS